MRINCIHIHYMSNHNKSKHFPQTEVPSNDYSSISVYHYHLILLTFHDFYNFCKHKILTMFIIQFKNFVNLMKLIVNLCFYDLKIYATINLLYFLYFTMNNNNNKKLFDVNVKTKRLIFQLEDIAFS